MERKEDLKKALIWFHSFSGNDFISFFFGKGKQLYWKTMKKNPSYIEAFEHLGGSWDVTVETMDTLQEYVCLLYRDKNISVTNTRFEIFHKNMSINLKFSIFYCYHHVNLYTNLFSIKLYCQNVEIISFIRY